MKDPSSAPQPSDTGAIHVAEVTQGAPYRVEEGKYPWIDGEFTIPTSLVTLINGGETQFRYGSLIGRGGRAVSKIANNVPHANSQSIQATLFNVLPVILRGENHPNAARVVNREAKSDLLQVPRKANVSRLFFVVEFEETPVVLRVATARASEEDRLLNILIPTRTPTKRRKTENYKSI